MSVFLFGIFRWMAIFDLLIPERKGRKLFYGMRSDISLLYPSIQEI